jgi:cytidylate kinase
MNKNEKFVITINREMGSGGRTVGRKLAEKLGVEFYYKSVLKGLEKKFNLTAEEVEKQKGREQGWWASIKRQLTGSVVSSSPFLPKVADENELIDTDDIFKAETEILKGIAEEESCVIAGRSGFFVFRDHPNHLSILIQASMPHRVKRVANKQNLTEEEARKAIDRVDKMRENYVNKYTHSSRYDTRNYDLVISMDGMTEDNAVDIIMDYINHTSKSEG